jgi:hypothetical protein
MTWGDRALFVWLYRGFPRILDAIMILRPETIVRWHPHPALKSRHRLLTACGDGWDSFIL